MVEQIIYQLLLLGIERDDADRLAGCNELRLFEPLDHLHHDGLGLDLVQTAALSLCVNTVYLVP